MDDPFALPEGTGVVIAPLNSSPDDGPVSAEEITRILSAMNRLLPLEIPLSTEAELAAWEQKCNQHGIDHAEKGLEAVFR
jgi:hypothetical protein